MRTRKPRHITGTFVLGAIIVTVGACGSALEAERAAGDDATRALPEQRTSEPSELQRQAMSIADVAEMAVPSVVNISTEKKVRMGGRRQAPFFNDPFFRHFFRGPGPRQPQERLQRGLGSGVIVRSDGIILTNNHVVEGAEEIVVTLHDKRELKAKVVGADPPSDLAVLKLEDPPADLPARPLGDSDGLRLGEVVVAIGNPFGVGQTVTMGIVSAKGRANVGLVDYEDFIQTDAAINPGNSGGALLNLQGQLVGINTAILSRSGGYQGIGFAIPSNMVQSILNSLLEDGKVVRGFLGVMIQDLSPDLARAMDIEASKGVLVSEVVPSSPADEAGLKEGDVITRIDGRDVATSAKLRNLVASIGAGRKVDIEVIRDGDVEHLSAELTEKSGKGGPLELKGDAGSLGGIEIEPLAPELRRRFLIPDRVRQGVVVTRVDRASAAGRAGLRPGDVILSVNRERIESPQDLRERFDGAGDTVLLRIHRRGGSMFLVLKKE